MIEQGAGVSETARSPGIPTTTLHGWVRRFRMGTWTTVAKLMREMGLGGKAKGNFNVKNPDSSPSFPIADIELDQTLEASQAGEVLLSDITYIPTGKGWLYLAGVLILCSRQLIGLAMGDTIDRHLTIDALHMALGRQKPMTGAIFHSYRGSQHAYYVRLLA